MGDDNNSQGRDKGFKMKKDIRCLMLSSTNYTVWSMRMKVIFRLYDVWDTFDQGSDDAKKNNMAIALIFQSVSEALLLQIGKHDTSKKIWKAIKSRNLGADRVREARLQTLMFEFDKLKMADTYTVDDYAGKLSCLASRDNGSIEDDIVGRLKAFEKCVKEETQDEDQSKLMFVKNDTQGRGSHNNSRGRGRGRSNGSDGHNKGGEASDKTKKDYSKVKCWRCDKMGHFVSHCPTQLREESNLTEPQEAYALYMHEVVFLNEERVFPKRFDECDGNMSIWYLDNGASNHMTGKKEFFSNLDESIKGKVKFGDGSNVEIVGKGSITFIGKTGERRALKDIYYIPSLKHNIISLGQATEMVCEVNMKEDLLMLKDPRGRLLVQVARKPNRLYKTPMEVEFPKCLQIQETNVTWTWHARLGHVNFGVMKNMVDKEMVVEMPQVIHEKDVCSACLVGKQTRKSFPPKAKYRASHALELVHESYIEAAVIQAWINAMKAGIESIIKNKTWKLVKKPADVKPIGLKWIYKIKRNADGTVIKYKARLVAKGYVQQQGIDFDEVFVPVARIETIRLLLALAATNGWEIHHLDVKNAFLNNGDLNEDVYVTQPEGFVEKGKEDHVYKLSKALYGLRQAPGAWNIKLDRVLKEMENFAQRY
ncbi:PREDICTED: uncharacterized protein LOC106320064 [Brassica oleracea var. oleracea]|uniref:uncharacterized protein LOC106320064 n=1 Tax=Brassica oleracea var. oleracea TaxID=109376 RepID=UPI0006A71291|nr:PREDICTED: uncharacterized protein LOC106320064 [Brassica oleracea var. oleracea]